jgi:uncharacterized protein YbjQ (UPF0145 family)
VRWPNLLSDLEAAKELLRAGATQVGANAILGAGFSHAQTAQGYEVMAYGTVVIMDPLPQVSGVSP